MATSLQLYTNQVFQFLQTCTVVFSPMAAQMNATLIAAGVSVDLTNPSSWKYYLNLSGQYHPSDTPIMIISLDNQQPVVLTQHLLTTSPKTQAAYVVGSPAYTALCQNYPAQADLIKSIVYPVDLSAALAAPDFTLLGWGEGYLEANEEEALLADLRGYIQYMVTRWYFPFLNTEVYYIWTFWGVFWQSLPTAIFAARLKYLHTSSVNSFHIWQSLLSLGIGDYSDVLTAAQALFLYRNIDYLLANKGKQSNLVILVDNLLSSLNVGLVGKTIYMNTQTQASVCLWTPEFVSTIIPTVNSQSLVLIAPESMTEINAELYSAKLDNNTSLAYVTAQQTAIGNTILNILPSKLVEIQQLAIDQKYGGLLNLFILDTLVSMITTGRYVTTIDIIDPTTNLPLSLSAKDALALFYYAVHQTAHETPTLLPTIYAPSCAFQYGITTSSIPESFPYHGWTYFTQQFFSPTALVGKMTYSSMASVNFIAIDNAASFASLTADLFSNLISLVRLSRVQGDLVALAMLRNYCTENLLQTTPYTFILHPLCPDYASWTTALNLGAVFSGIGASVDVSAAYSNLADAVLTALLPETNNPIFTFFGYTPPDTFALYERLKTLFVELCSYNIEFLDTSRVIGWWVFSDVMGIELTSLVDVQILDLTKYNFCPPMTSVDFIPISAPSLDQLMSVTAAGNITVPVKYDDMLTVSLTSTQSLPGSPGSTIAVPSQSSMTAISDNCRLRTALFTGTTMGVT